MEEAYNELYQQFLCLRSLCLRQAALLHQLTTALQKQQGAPVPNGELSDTMSIPVQCTQEIPMFFYDKPQPLAAAARKPAARKPAARKPAAQCGLDYLTKNMGAFSTLLAEDMAKLSVDMPRQRKEDRMLEPKAASLLTLDSSKWQEASESKTPGQAAHRGTDMTVHTMRMPTTDIPSLLDDFHQSGGVLLSDVALQSHTCEFCQAVFPGDTTTRGEFIRHLHTHIT